MKIYINPSQETWTELSKRPQLELEFLDSSVRNVLNRVKKSGDDALRELTLQYDKVSIQALRVSEEELADHHL
jgi:histidinol dehydrogenase